LRPVLAVVIIGSGVVGFLGIGWLGLVLPIVNFLIVHTTFVGSTQGAIDQAAIARAVEHLQICAVILHRWCVQSPADAAAWVGSGSRMKSLTELVMNLSSEMATSPSQREGRAERKRRSEELGRSLRSSYDKTLRED